jgi:hypothetical protein
MIEKKEEVREEEEEKEGMKEEKGENEPSPLHRSWIRHCPRANGSRRS